MRGPQQVQHRVVRQVTMHHHIGLCQQRAIRRECGGIVRIGPDAAAHFQAGDDIQLQRQAALPGFFRQLHGNAPAFAREMIADEHQPERQHRRAGHHIGDFRQNQIRVTAVQLAAQRRITAGLLQENVTCEIADGDNAAAARTGQHAVHPPPPRAAFHAEASRQMRLKADDKRCAAQRNTVEGVQQVKTPRRPWAEGSHTLAARIDTVQRHERTPLDPMARSARAIERPGITCWR